MPGEISVTSTGDLTTTGAFSAGAKAQSIGGAGGNGGFAAAIAGAQYGTAAQVTRFDRPVTRPNVKALRQYLNHTPDVGGAEKLNDLLLYLGEQQDVSIYRRSINLLSPEVYLAPMQVATYAGEDDIANVMSCHTGDGSTAAIVENGCGWVKVYSNTLQRRSTADDFGSATSTTAWPRACYIRFPVPGRRAQPGLGQPQDPEHGRTCGLQRRYVYRRGYVEMEGRPGPSKAQAPLRARRSSCITRRF